MKRYPKEINCNSKGQIVVPREIRRELSIDEGTGFWIFMVQDEGILLKKIELPELGIHDALFAEMIDKSSKIGIDKRNIEKTIQSYKKITKGDLEEI